MKSMCSRTGEWSLRANSFAKAKWLCEGCRATRAKCFARVAEQRKSTTNARRANASRMSMTRFVYFLKGFFAKGLVPKGFFSPSLTLSNLFLPSPFHTLLHFLFVQFKCFRTVAVIFLNFFLVLTVTLLCLLDLLLVVRLLSPFNCSTVLTG